MLDRAGHRPDRLGRHTGIERRRVELGMSERPRAIMLLFYVIEIEWSAERDLMLAVAAARAARHRPLNPPP